MSDRVVFSCLNCGMRFPYVVAEYDGPLPCPYCQHWVELPKDRAAAGEGDISPPRDLKFLDAWPFLPEIADEAYAVIQTAELRNPAAIFISNVNRLWGLLTLPKTITRISHMLHTMTTKATPAIMQDLKGPPDSIQRERIRRSALDLWNKWEVAITQLEREHLHVQIYKQCIEDLKAFGGADAWLGLESILISQITGMWTAFEVLSGDLWEAALNAHPRGLSDLKGGGGASGTDAKSMPIGELQQYDFDVSKKMGTLLRYKYNFTVLEKTKLAYRHAFDEDAVSKHIEADCVKGLCSLRNVFLHRAGIVDKKFKGELSVIQSLASLNVGDRVPVDGPLICEVTPPVFLAAIGLIKEVDKWIVNH